MRKVRVVTTTKGQTYDPEGRAVAEALQQLGINTLKMSRWANMPC